MRPRELTLEGFRSYRHRATFGFRGRRLIGVVGPIGAGKSSLLDAIVFALYGKTPTFERDTRSLIHQLAEVARVQLEFEVDGQRWRATRAIKRKGQSQHKLERLSDEGDLLPDPVTGERGVREKVELLLGMDFAAFCRSVMLAQGRFAEFLQATAKERTDVLKGVFGYERFDAALGAARERAATAEGELSVLAQEGERLVAAKGELEAATAARGAARTRHHELEAATERIRALEIQATEASEREREATTRLGSLTALVATLPETADVAHAVDRAREAAARREDADHALAAASKTLEDAEASRAAVADRVGDHGAVADLADVVARMEHEAIEATRAREVDALAQEARQTAIGEIEIRRAEHAAAADDEGAHAATAAAAAATTAEAEAALHDARHAEMAAELRRGLRRAEPCPVCAQQVTTLPSALRAPKVDAAEHALEDAKRAETGARTEHRRATETVAAAVARLQAAEAELPRRSAASETAQDERRRAEAALGATQSELVDRLGDGDPRALLEARRRELEDAEKAAEDARETERRARDLAASVGTEQTAVDAALAGVRDAVIAAWGRLGETASVPSDPVELRDAFGTIGERLTAELERARGDAGAAEAAAADIRERSARERDAIGLRPDADVARALGESQGAVTAAEATVSGLEGVLAAGSDLEVRLGEALACRDLAKRLVADLQPSRFLGFVLEEERRALAELGSHHLEELTDGAYRFTEDDVFDVVDVNAASTKRSADSLSGGETFLASLALALALAEMVARGGGRLDSFFLDEGFGSLDPEHLDRAMDGVARLVAGDTDRLVVLVSHVEQMRQTLEDLIVLDKDPRTGDTIVVSGATSAT